MSHCLFCQIIEGDVPSAIIYEDETVLAFLDISQTTPGHTLLIPKKHHDNLLTMSPQEVGQLSSYIPILSHHLLSRLGASGINVLSNLNEAAGQVVFHAHIHLIPRFDSHDLFHIQMTNTHPNAQRLSQLTKQLSLKGGNHE